MRTLPSDVRDQESKGSKMELTRRFLLKALLYCTALPTFGQPASAQEEKSKDGQKVADDMVPFKWALRQSDIDRTVSELRDKAHLEGRIEPFRPSPEEIDDYTHSNFDPMMMLTGAIAVAFLIERIVALVRDGNHGGVIIDARGRELNIREHPALSARTVVVVTPTGVQQFDSSHQVDIVSAVKASFPGEKKP